MNVQISNNDKYLLSMKALGSVHTPLDYIKLMGDLPIPGVKAVASPLGKILDFFLPKSKVRVDEKLDEALEILNNSYSLLEQALSEKAFEIYSNDINHNIDLIIDYIGGNEGGETSVIFANKLLGFCDQITTNMSGTIEQGTDILQNFEASTKLSSGTMVHYVGDYSRTILSCYQAAVLSNYGFSMVLAYLESDEIAFKQQIKTIENHKDTVYWHFEKYILEVVSKNYPKWCEGFFTLHPVTFENVKKKDEYLYNPGNDVGFGYNTMLFHQKKRFTEGRNLFAFKLIEDRETDPTNSARWNMYSKIGTEELPLFVVTWDQGKGFTKGIYSRFDLNTGNVNPISEYDLGVSYSKQKVLINALREAPTWNLTLDGDLFAVLKKEDGDKSKWICRTMK